MRHSPRLTVTGPFCHGTVCVYIVVCVCTCLQCVSEYSLFGVCVVCVCAGECVRGVCVRCV